MVSFQKGKKGTGAELSLLGMVVTIYCSLLISLLKLQQSVSYSG